MMNRLLLKLPLIYLVVTIFIVIASWLGSYYGADMRNILSAEGVRWWVENLVRNVRVSPLSDIVFLLVAMSVLTESGVLKVFSAGGKSPKQSRAMQLTLGVLLLYLLLLATMTILPPSILLSVFGTVTDSPLSRGMLGLVVMGMLLVGNFYGFVSGRFLTLHDFVNAHLELLRQGAQVLLSVITGAQLMGAIGYTFMDLPHYMPQLLSVAIYYMPLVMHLFVTVRR